MHPGNLVESYVGNSKRERVSKPKFFWVKYQNSKWKGRCTSSDMAGNIFSSKRVWRLTQSKFKIFRKTVKVQTFIDSNFSISESVGCAKLILDPKQSFSSIPSIKLRGHFGYVISWSHWSIGCLRTFNFFTPFLGSEKKFRISFLLNVLFNISSL